MGIHDTKRIDGVIAVRGGEDAHGSEARPEEVGLLRATREEFQAFRQAGWRFVGATTPQQVRAPNAQTAQIYLAGDRHLLLSDGSLNVKFRDDVSSDVVQSRLQQAGFSIRQRIPVGENTFRVKSVNEDDDRDIREAAQSLESLDEVEFAEPDFIQTFGRR